MSKKKIIFTSSIIFVLCIIIGLIYFFGDKVNVTLIGNENIDLEVSSKYEELGAKASVCSKGKCKNISDQIKIKESIDINKLGSYKVIYELKYKKKTYSKTRVVNIVDTKSPDITLKGNQDAIVCPGKEYEEEGYEATDNYDKDLTSKVQVIKKDNQIEYKVSDSSGNKSSIIRSIKQEDKESPIISLNGANTINLYLNGNYQELGVTVNDNCSQIDSSKVQINNPVDTSKEGTYKVTYTVEDDSGNTATEYRTINVIKSISFNTTNKQEYINNLERYIKEKNYNVSIGYVNLNSNYTYLYNQNVVYYGASLVKTVDALYVYENLAFDENTRIKVEKAISVSDNTAHRQLVDMIGIENLRYYGRNIGASIFLNRSNSDYYGNTTVNDQIAIWKYLYKVINNNNNNKGNELKNYFINSYYNFLLFDGIPTTMHKYGYYGNYYHDVGIVYSNSPYIVVILTKHGSNNFQTVVKDLSEKIYGLNKIDT